MKTVLKHLQTAFVILFFPALPGAIRAQTFSYDASGRLNKATYTDGSVAKYRYDAAGNLKKVQAVPAVTASISAGESSSGVASFKVQRTGDLSQPLTVSLAASGDAMRNQDYSPFPASVTFPAHESSVSFSVTLRTDRLASATKKLIVSLAESDNYNLDKNLSATVTLPAKK